jgi:hypothetical protein
VTRGLQYIWPLQASYIEGNRDEATGVVMTSVDLSQDNVPTTLPPCDEQGESTRILG